MLLRVAVALLAVWFLIAFSARPTIILSSAQADDALFVRLGQSIASGAWLGAYDHMTLVKGPGFPAFLALLNLLGLPFLLGLSLFHLACVGFAAHVVSRLLNSALAGAILFALLLLLPLLYFGDATRVFRDVFYTSLTVALVAAVIGVTAVGYRHAWAVVATAVLGAWWWLTREEGVWLALCLGLLAVSAFLRPSAQAGAERNARQNLTVLAPASVAALLAAAIVAGVGILNWMAYGRFVVNEIKDPAFQGALEALQSAGAPYSSEKLPVPRQARTQIYAASPAFARLREPILDGPLQPRFAASACMAEPVTCGDIGGGWFMWMFREAAALDGQHSSPMTAAAFYRRIEHEVRRACGDGRLQCIDWRLPLVPPMRASEIDDVVRSAAEATRIVTFSEPVWVQAPPSDLSGPRAEAMYRFLNRPNYASEPLRLRLSGWFVARGAEWFELVPGAQVTVTDLRREASPDLVAAFKDSSLERQRFTLSVVCPSTGACPAELRWNGQSHRLDLMTWRPGRPAINSGARLHVDVVEGQDSHKLLRNRVSGAWVAFAARINPLYQVLAWTGIWAVVLLMAASLARRKVSVTLVVSLALLSAAAARVLIIALVDALSFPAANPVYMLPAAPLLVMGAVIALHQVVVEGRALARWRGPVT